MRKASAEDDARNLDELLIERLRKGDIEALNAVFRKHIDGLCDYAFRFVKSRDEAEEVVQSVFFKLWRDRSHIAIRGSVAQFLYLSVRNRSLDYIKHELVKENWKGRVAAETSFGIDGGATPEGALEAAERAAAISRAFSELPGRRREVCALRWNEGLSYLDIAHRLNISEKTVKNQLARGIEQVRTRVKELL